MKEINRKQIIIVTKPRKKSIGSVIIGSLLNMRQEVPIDITNEIIDRSVLPISFPKMIELKFVGDIYNKDKVPYHLSR